MTTRERWIVYPLLFLTLGIAMRNQFLPTKRMGAVDFRAGELTAQTIRCDQIEVMQEGKCNNFQFNSAQGNRLVSGYSQSLQSNSTELESRIIKIIDEQGRPVVLLVKDENTKAGAIQTMTEAGSPQVQIHSNTTGGIITAIGHLGQVLVAMGHEGDAFGVFAQFAQRPPFPLTSPWRFQTQPSPKLTPSPLTKTPPEEKKDEPKKNEPKPDEKQKGKTK